MAKKNWIPKDLDEGALTKKAKNAGFSSWEAYCNSVGDNASTKTKRQCNLARQFKKMRK